MNNRWIQSQASSGKSREEIYGMYDEYKADTGSDCDLDSFKRRVRKATQDPANKQEQGGTEEKGDRLEAWLISATVETPEQLIEHLGIDTDRWKLNKFSKTFWGSEKNKNWRTKADFIPRASDYNLKREWECFIEDAKKHAPTYPRVFTNDSPRRLGRGNQVVAEISMYDLHLGQLSWGTQTRDANYDIKIAKQVFLDAVDNFLGLLGGLRNVKEFVFPIGNDFFNVNSSAYTTFRGTFQDEDVRNEKSFRYGRDMVVSAIDKMLEIAPVRVVIVPGNHDTEKTFYLGEVIDAWYSKCDYVTVDNRPTMRKYIMIDNTLIGYTHGDKEKIEQLPLIMADEVPELWAKSIRREWHIGHTHSSKSKGFIFSDESRGVRVKTLPSLAPASSWSAGQGYGSLREAIMILWGKGGQVETHTYMPPIR
jgi:hypothetical protein